MLSEQHRRALIGIECQFAAEDPQLAGALGSMRYPKKASRPGRIARSVLFAVALCIPIVATMTLAVGPGWFDVVLLVAVVIIACLKVATVTGTRRPNRRSDHGKPLPDPDC
ncbi:MAG TPA: DUF3040 domain-containing protein [Pseudonocardia sp.]|nr:DUF3040 domain-containing protein [Pseudonocardia sp.]